MAYKKIKDGVYRYLFEEWVPGRFIAPSKEVFDAVELHVSKGVTDLYHNQFSDFKKLERLYLPSTITHLGDGIFYGLYHHPINIYFDGEAEDFARMAAPVPYIAEREVSGPYDGYPYYITQDNYIEKYQTVSLFDDFAGPFAVHCKGGKTLVYDRDSLYIRRDLGIK